MLAERGNGQECVKKRFQLFNKASASLRFSANARLQTLRLDHAFFFFRSQPRFLLALRAHLTRNHARERAFVIERQRGVAARRMMIFAPV